MTSDLWQLRKWYWVECILSPRPKSRTILIAGEIVSGYPVNYKVVFKTKSELTAFALRYSDLFEPLIYQPDFTLDEKLIMWDYFEHLSERRLYSEGPGYIGP